MPTVMVSLLGKHPPTRVSANPVDARIGAYIRGYYDLSRHGCDYVQAIDVLGIIRLLLKCMSCQLCPV